MPKKNLLLLSSLLIANNTGATFTIDPTSYRHEARVWARTYVCDDSNKLLVSSEDLILIANLCYLSFMRSYCTLHAQDIALQAINSVWQGWQNIAQTRLDPSQKAPFTISEQRKEMTGELFWTAHDEHRIMGTTYAQAAETIVHKSGLSTLKAARGVDDLRSRARSVMAQALLDVRTYLGTVFQADQTKGVMDLWKGFCFIKHRHLSFSSCIKLFFNSRRTQQHRWTNRMASS